MKSASALTRIAILVVAFSIHWRIYDQLPPHQGAPTPPPWSLVTVLIVIGTVASLSSIRDFRHRSLGCALTAATHGLAAAILLLSALATLGGRIFGAVDWAAEHPHSQLTFEGWSSYVKSCVGIWGVTLLVLTTIDLAVVLSNRATPRRDLETEEPPA